MEDISTPHQNRKKGEEIAQTRKRKKLQKNSTNDFSRKKHTDKGLFVQKGFYAFSNVQILGASQNTTKL